MPTLRLFASAREAAGTARTEIDADTVGEILEKARQQFGERFGRVLDTSRVWVNGQPAELGTTISGHDIVAVLPPVSGGSTPPAAMAPARVAQTAAWTPDPGTAGAGARASGEGGAGAGGGGSEAGPAGAGSAAGGAGGGAAVGGGVAAGAAVGGGVGAGAAGGGGVGAGAIGAVGGGIATGAGAAATDGTAVSGGDSGPKTSRMPRPPRPARPLRRLRLVPSPVPDGSPADDPSAADRQPDPAPAAPVVTTMGRLALAPVASPEPLPDAPPAWPAPSAPPSPAPSPSPSPAPMTPPASAPAPVSVPQPTPAGQQAVAAAAVPQVAPTAEPKPAAPLAVVHQSIRPHGRLGVAWALVTAGALAAGPGWLAWWLAVIAFVAASQTANVWRKRGERPLPGFAAATAAALPLTAVTGVDHMNMAVAGAVVLTLVARLASPTKAPGRDVGLTLVIGMSIGMAAAAPVLLRSINLSAALYLLACAALYDAGAYLVGTGASSVWEGPAAGVVTLLPLTMFAALAFVPPFGGVAPWLLGAMAAVLAPFGPVAGSALLGDRTAHAPALRRLDSLLIMGPIWAWCAAALLT